MNILWIEDFGGGLQPSSDLLRSMFRNLISFDDWDEDEVSLLSRPVDLENFFKTNSTLHCVYLCRHYFDYLEFKVKHDILRNIDSVIIDIRLNSNVDLDRPIPNEHQEKDTFHQNAGFYIYNDLVHLGVPPEKMCFMTGEKNSFTEFEAKCNDIYIPGVTGFEKNDAEYKKLREWIDGQNSDYTILRRGVIEGCHFLKSYLENDETNLQFRGFIKTDEHQRVIDIESTDIVNYLDTLAQFLPLKQPNKQYLNVQYRLFLRTLVHEWEESIDPNAIKHDGQNILDITTFAWLAKMARNWTTHANLLEPLDPQIMAFLFLVNMRAMFKLPKVVQPYEQILLGCLPKMRIDHTHLKSNIDQFEKNIDGILVGLKISEFKEDNNGKKKVDDNRQEVKKNFADKINAIYRQNTGNPDAEKHDFQAFLFQYFWVNQKKSLHKINSTKEDFLPVLACHIYKSSFPEV